ncbi:MAG: hypothetical protein KKF33_00720 [Alphaproteobacteria bacterium]|nr:hypothetical protein [Alphaproteobacteria bacterium]
MLKTIITAAFATVSLVTVSLPAQAATGNDSVGCDAGYSISDNADSLITRLEAKGVAVSGVEDWSGCVRAYVTKADGTTGMVIYDPTYLTPVSQSNDANV